MLEDLGLAAVDLGELDYAQASMHRALANDNRLDVRAAIRAFCEQDPSLDGCRR